MLGCNWGIITSKGHDGLGPSTGVLVPHKGVVWNGVALSNKEGLECYPRKFDFKIMPSGVMSAKKLVSVGLQNGTVKREKLVLRYRIK